MTSWYVTDLDSTNGVLFATVLGTEVEATPGVEAEAGEGSCSATPRCVFSGAMDDGSPRGGDDPPPPCAAG